jgi:hypothetical protein
MSGKYLIIFISILFSCGLHAQDLSNIKNQKPFTIGGSLNLRGIFTGSSGIPSTTPAAAFVATGDLTPTIYGISLPLSFSYSNDGSNSFSQPFNRFGISPTYKWVTIHAGYQNLNYQPFTLSGHSINGFGFDLTPGKWRASFIYGKLNSATTIDTLTQSLVDASYSRKGYAAKIGYGSKDNFVELSLLSAKDDTSSLRFNKANYDATLGYPALTATQNAVAGLSYKLTFFKKLTWETNAALSVYVNDMQSPLLNDSSVSGIYNPLKSLVKVNGSTDYGSALLTAIGYKEKYYSVKLQYQRIAPKFNSMGTYYLQNDLETYTLMPTAVLWKNRVRLNGSFGIQRDNLSNQKTATSKRFIGSLNGSAEFTANFGVDLNYSNYNTNQAPVATRINDTLRITQSTYNIGIMPRYIINKENFGHVIMLNIQESVLNNFNSAYTPGAQSSVINSLNSVLNYQLRFNKSGANAGAALNYTQLSGADVNGSNYGITLNGGKPFFNNSLIANVSGSYLISQQNGVQGNIINASAQATYTFHKKHSFGLNVNYTNNVPKTVSPSSPQYSNTRLELSYGFRF